MHWRFGVNLHDLAYNKRVSPAYFWQQHCNIYVPLQLNTSSLNHGSRLRPNFIPLLQDIYNEAHWAPQLQSHTQTRIKIVDKQPLRCVCVCLCCDHKQKSSKSWTTNYSLDDLAQLDFIINTREIAPRFLIDIFSSFECVDPTCMMLISSYKRWFLNLMF